MNLFKRSDNYPFYAEFNVPSQTICTFDFTNYSYYHRIHQILYNAVKITIHENLPSQNSFLAENVILKPDLAVRPPLTHTVYSKSINGQPFSQIRIVSHFWRAVK